MSKAVKKSNVNCTTYSWKSLKCDICKEELPLTIPFEGRKYEIFSLPKPNSNYIILQDFRRQKYDHIVHILVDSNAPLLIGRSADTDLKINDVSVSRSHAVINCYKNIFYLKDCGSKFGSLIILKRPLIIEENKDAIVQVNRTVFFFKFKSRIKFFESLKNCCKKNHKVEAFPKTRTEIIWEEISLQSSNNDE